MMDHHDTIKCKITNKTRNSVENLIKVEAGATFGVVWCGGVGCAVSDMTRLYWLEVGLLLNETMTTQERESVNECRIDRCPYIHT